MKWYRFVLLVIFLSVFSCGKNDDDNPEPDPPVAAVLIFPEENSECTTGVDLGNGTSEVTFRWQTSENTDLYTINVVNLETTVPQTLATTQTSTTLTITRGAPFSWSITSTNSSNLSAISDNWLFYNAGAQTNYAPFPAQIVYPTSGKTVQMNDGNEVELRWTGADVEDDIETYEVYFSASSADEVTLVQSGAETTYVATGLVSQGVYYWKVVTIDSQGNSSDSGVFDFKVL